MEAILKATETTRTRFKVLLPFTLLAVLSDAPGLITFLKEWCRPKVVH